jgi:DNA-nicking Smr family endonuclease
MGQTCPARPRIASWLGEKATSKRSSGRSQAGQQHRQPPRRDSQRRQPLRCNSQHRLRIFLRIVARHGTSIGMASKKTQGASRSNATQRVKSTITPEEVELFMGAVANVAPLDSKQRDRVKPLPAPTIVRRAEPPVTVKLAISGDPSSFEMRAPGVSRNELAGAQRQLHIEETLDLHGDTVAVATGKFQAFMHAASQRGRRCVMIIHGKGLHSDGVSVLRNMVIEQLAGELSGYVHAASTAAARDGGEGATYVMLRSGARRR